MKKIVISLLLFTSYILPNVNVTVYEGSTLTSFKKQDKELAQAIHESGWSLFSVRWSSWAVTPSAERIARMRNNIATLESKLPIIENTYQEIYKKRDEIAQQYSFLRGGENPALAIAGIIMLFPWFLLNEVAKDRAIAPYNYALENIKKAKNTIMHRIETLKKVVQKYSL